MKPIDQLTLHDPENGQYGDCQRACIASLLEMNPLHVPHFCEGNPSSVEFWDRVYRFLATQGLMHLETQAAVLFNKEALPCYHMIYGKTERGTNHAVVALNGEIVHDPHPSRAGLLESDRENWTYAFLVMADCRRDW